jgi:HNH endonuclease
MIRSEPADACWLWSGARTAAGYGARWLDGRTRYVHRLSYEALVGPIPEGLTIDHLCHNRACCNPAHMEVVTRSENGRRGAQHSVVMGTFRGPARRKVA